MPCIPHHLSILCSPAYLTTILLYAKDKLCSWFYTQSLNYLLIQPLQVQAVSLLMHHCHTQHFLLPAAIFLMEVTPLPTLVLWRFLLPGLKRQVGRAETLLLSQLQAVKQQCGDGRALRSCAKATSSSCVWWGMWCPWEALSKPCGQILSAGGDSCDHIPVLGLSAAGTQVRQQELQLVLRLWWWCQGWV